MYGFRVRHNGTELAVALPEGVSGVVMDNKNEAGEFSVSVGGCDRLGQAHRWYLDWLRPGDEVEFTFEDIPAAEIHPSTILDYTRPENRRAALIEAYRQLKQELTDEGFL